MDKRKELHMHIRIVVKVGTTTLAYPNGRLNLQRLEQLSWVLTDLRHSGKEIILVSSGAIAVGAERLGLSERPRDTRGKQAASAVGQAVLMQIYQNFFAVYNQQVAQILLTQDVLDEKLRRENARNTFFTLLSMGVIPIVNANDTVSTDELDSNVSENDTLAAYVARLTDSGLLIILSDIEGMYEEDPKVNPQAKLIREVSAFSGDLERMASGSFTALGTGGMATKVNAAKIAAQAGIDAIIASGAKPNIIFDIINGESVGTLFHAG